MIEKKKLSYPNTPTHGILRALKVCGKPQFLSTDRYAFTAPFTIYNLQENTLLNNNKLISSRSYIQRSYNAGRDKDKLFLQNMQAY